jgi:hypothetical protein
LDQAFDQWSLASATLVDEPQQQVFMNAHQFV